VTNCRSFDAQIGSDHKLVIANLKMRLRSGVRPTENLKYDTNKLADYDTRQMYEDEVEKKEHSDRRSGKLGSHVVKHTKRYTNSSQ